MQGGWAPHSSGRSGSRISVGRPPNGFRLRKNARDFFVCPKSNRYESIISVRKLLTSFADAHSRRSLEVVAHEWMTLVFSLSAQARHTLQNDGNRNRYSSLVIGSNSIWQDKVSTHFIRTCPISDKREALKAFGIILTDRSNACSSSRLSARCRFFAGRSTPNPSRNAGRSCLEQALSSCLNTINALPLYPFCSSSTASSPGGQVPQDILNNIVCQPTTANTNVLANLKLSVVSSKCIRPFSLRSSTILSIEAEGVDLI